MKAVFRNNKVKWMAPLAALLIAFPFLAPNNYLVHIINLIGIYTLLTLGFNVLTGYTGLVSLGQAGFYAIGGYTTGLCNKMLGLNPWISMIIGVLVTILFGAVLAMPALRVKDKYLVLLTIGFAEIVRLVALNWISLTGGPSGITGIAAPVFLGIKLNTSVKFYFLILICVVLGFIYQYFLIRSRAGRAFIAIREDENAAQLAGINLASYKVKAFMISAFFSGLAGVLYAHLVHYVSPDTFTYNESVLILCMGIIGGMGTLTGPIIGAGVLTILPEMLRQFSSVRMIVYGLLLIVVISVSSGGLESFFSKLFHKVRARFTQRRLGDAEEDLAE